MLFIISGTSRSGKTLASKRILETYKIPYLSLDYLMMGFMNGVTEMGIHDKLWPQEIAQKMWRFLEPFFETIIYSGDDYLVEGEAILPEIIKPFIDKHKGSVKVCFIGYTDVILGDKVQDVIKYANKDKDWLVKLGKKEIISHISNMIEYSKELKSKTKQYDLKYFDTSHNFNQEIEQCITYLMEK